MKTPILILLKASLIVLVCYIPCFADFSLFCPPDVTVNCREDYLHDLNVYGRAYTDYNGFISYIHDCGTIIELDDCGKGTIKRTWGAENPENWKWLTCTQIITISNAGSFGYRDITWPLSTEIISCDPESDLKLLTAPYDAPEWERTVCAKPMLSYKDTRFAVNPGCIKLLREWKILDWCQYDPINYPGRGIFSYTQVIKLIQNSDAPQLQCIKDTVVVNNRNCDSIWIDLPPAVFHSTCPIYHSIVNNSAYAGNGGADASGYYPNGKTSFYYLVEYACGTVQKCEVHITVVNGIKPTPYCLTGVIAGLMPIDLDRDGNIDEGMVEVWASDLDKGSWHKCPGQNLKFSFSSDTSLKSRVFACDDVGENEVEIWVTDQDGNQDLCKTIVVISNTNPNIPDCDGNFRGSNNTLIGAQWSSGKASDGNDLQSLVARTIATPRTERALLAIPGENKAIVDGSKIKQGRYVLECLDLQGKPFFTRQIMLRGDQQLIELGVLPTGMNLIRLHGEGMSEVSWIQKF
ncbi:MAG: hypothetical protein IPM34_07605 [Saprospiraceae bacterium]|nr:hypothetical protein [Saprospiraceae bacterium]